MCICVDSRCFTSIFCVLFFHSTFFSLSLSLSTFCVCMYIIAMCLLLLLLSPCAGFLRYSRFRHHKFSSYCIVCSFLSNVLDKKRLFSVWMEYCCGCGILHYRTTAKFTFNHFIVNLSQWCCCCCVCELIVITVNSWQFQIALMEL